jgi:hypothetical protein
VGKNIPPQMGKSIPPLTICKDVNPVTIGISKRSSHLSLSMAEKLLKLHMSDHSKIKIIAEALNKSFYHHGYPLGRTEAATIGLPVAAKNVETEALIWQVWQDVESEMQCNKPTMILYSAYSLCRFRP